MFIFTPALMYKMYLDFNGQVVRLPGFGSQNITELALSTARGPYEFLSIVFDGMEWLANSYSRRLYDNLRPEDASVLTHGQVYFQWNGSASQFELCQLNGPGGLIVDGSMLQVPNDCLTLGSQYTSSNGLNYFYAVQTGTDAAESVTGVADNGSGLIELTISNLGNAGDQVAIMCHSILGAYQANGTWTGKVVSNAAIDLLDSSSVGLGSYTPNTGKCRIVRLDADTTGHATGANGVEIMNGDGHDTLVGIAYIGASNAVSDSSTKRDVASWFNGKVKTCINNYTADRTWTNTGSWGEPSTEIRCEFVVFDDEHENAKSWSITGMFGNNTVGDGTLVTAGFNPATSIAPEPEVAGQKGNNIALGVHGSKAGLSEGQRFITLLAKTIGGGTSTVYGATPATSLEIQLWQ